LNICITQCSSKIIQSYLGTQNKQVYISDIPLPPLISLLRGSSPRILTCQHKVFIACEASGITGMSNSESKTWMLINLSG